jgi:3-oxoacyl-[acyl-carrier-protein] synthase-3
MADLSFAGIEILGIASSVPENIYDNSDLTSLLPEEDLEKVISNIGVRKRRIANHGTTSVDLCIAAAKQLINDLNIDRDEINMILFLSQTPDHVIPASSPYIQNELGLSTDTACIDLSLACSGYVYALSTAFAYAQTSGVQKVLLLVGEVFSKIVSREDRVNWPLYGDGGTATLISENDKSKNKSTFSLFSDGSGFKSIIIPDGGSRIPISDKSYCISERENGNRRSDTQLFMDGLEVFNFTLRNVPKAVKHQLIVRGITIGDIDRFYFHQANQFMIDFFVKKLKIDSQKVFNSISEFGNVSSASIPITLSQNKGIISNEKIMLIGFGAGLSWASTILEVSSLNIIGCTNYIDNE